MQHDSAEPSNAPDSKSSPSVKAKLFCLEKAVNSSNISGYQYVKDYFELKKVMMSANTKAADVTEKILQLNESIKNSDLSDRDKNVFFKETGKIYAAIVSPGSSLNQKTKEIDNLILNFSNKHSAYQANVESVEKALYFIRRFNESQFQRNRNNSTYFDKIANAEKTLLESGDIGQALSALQQKDDKKDNRPSIALPRLSFFSTMNKSVEQINFSAIKEMLSDTVKEFNNRNKPVAAEKKSLLRR